MTDEKKEDKSSGNLAVDLGKAILSSPVVEEVRPTVREAGLATSTLGMAVNAALGPLRLWGLRHSLSNRNTEAMLRADAEIELQRRLEDRLRPLTVYCEPMQEENKQLSSSSMRAVNDIVEGFLLTDDTGEEDELRDMYARLLATAMDDRSEKVHPAFAKIIGEVTAQEANLFNFFYRSPYAKFQIPPHMSADLQEKIGPINFMSAAQSLARHQLVTLSWEESDGLGFEPKMCNFVRFTEFGSQFGEAVTGEVHVKSFRRESQTPNRISNLDKQREEDALIRKIEARLRNGALLRGR